jgi:hypothetical protein
VPIIAPSSLKASRPNSRGFAKDNIASLCLCISLQLANSLIILCAPRLREPVGVIERGWRGVTMSENG